MVRWPRRIQSDAKSRPARSDHPWGKQFRPMLEALEVRALPSFAAPVSYPIGTQPSTWIDGVATGDFAGNGLQDLAVVHNIDNTVNILLNNGDGTFQPAVSYPTGSVGPAFVSVADFTGSGILDLAVTGGSPTGDTGLVSVLMGNGDGTFKPAVSYAVDQHSWGGLAVGDFSGNGFPDLAIVTFTLLDANHNAVQILRNNGDGTFQPPQLIPVPLGAHWVTTGDFTGNGRADLAVVDGFGNDGMLDHDHPAGVTILRNNGDGTFQTAGQYDSPATPGGGVVTPYVVTAGDLRGLGITDVIVSNYDHNINVLLGNGDGTFQAPIGIDTGEYPRMVAVADVNNDGIPDLVVGNVGSASETPPAPGSVAVFLGNGDGTFQDPSQYTPFNYPSTLAAADFNGDGMPDIAVTQVQDGHSVDVMINLGETRTAASLGVGPSPFVPAVPTPRPADPESSGSGSGVPTADAPARDGVATPLSIGGAASPVPDSRGAGLATPREPTDLVGSVAGLSPAVLADLAANLLS